MYHTIETVDLESLRKLPKFVALKGSLKRALIPYSFTIKSVSEENVINRGKAISLLVEYDDAGRCLIFLGEPEIGELKRLYQTDSLDILVGKQMLGWNRSGPYIGTVNEAISPIE